MSLADELKSAIERREFNAVADLLVASTEKERRSAASEVWDLYHSEPYRTIRFDPTSRVNAAIGVALLGCSSLGELRTSWVWPMSRYTAGTGRVVGERPAAFQRGVVKVLLQRGGGSWGLLYGLVRDGVVDKPDDDAFYIQMLDGIPNLRKRGIQRLVYEAPAEAVEAIVETLRADPDLLADVWKPWTIEESAAALGEPHLRGAWVPALAALVAARDIPRERAIDESLDGMLRDFRPHAMRVFPHLYRALAPDQHEAAGRSPKLLSIARVQNPVVQKFAIGELASLEEADRGPEAHLLADACAHALTTTQKDLAMRCLRLLDQLAERAPEEALRAVAVALGHTRDDVQERALSMLNRHSEVIERSVDLREELLRWSDVVDPQHGDALLGLLGIAPAAPETDEEEPFLDQIIARIEALPAQIAEVLALDRDLADVMDGNPPAPVSFLPWDPPILSERRRILPVEEPEELVDVLAALIAGGGDGVDVERALDALSRFCDRDDPDLFDLLLAFTRLDDLEWQYREWPGTTPWDLAVVVDAWITQVPPRPLSWLKQKRQLPFRRRPLRGDLVARLTPESEYMRVEFDGSLQLAGFVGFTSARAWEIASRAAKREARPLLSMPTHLAGWLDPAVLVERVGRYEEERWPLERFDTVQAVLRLPPSGSESLPDSLDAAVQRDEGLARAMRQQGYPIGTATVEAGRIPGKYIGRGRPIDPDERYLRFSNARRDSLRRDDPVGYAETKLHIGEAGNAWWWTSWASQLGSTPPTVSAEMLVAPSRPDLVWADITASAATDLDSNRSADPHGFALQAALDGDAPGSPTLMGAIAIGLSTKNEGLRSAAVDVVAEATTDGRLDVDSLASQLADFTNAGLVACARYSAALVPVTAMSDLHAEAVRRTLMSVLAGLDEVPRDVHALLEALNAACVATGAGLEDPMAKKAAESIAKGSPGSKRGKLAKRLLALPERRTPVGALVAAIEGRVQRAERWAAALD